MSGIDRKNSTFIGTYICSNILQNAFFYATSIFENVTTVLLLLIDGCFICFKCLKLQKIVNNTWVQQIFIYRSKQTSHMTVYRIVSIFQNAFKYDNFENYLTTSYLLKNFHSYIT